MANELGPIHYTGSANGLFALWFNPAFPDYVYVTNGSSSDVITAIDDSDVALQAHAVAVTAQIANHYYGSRPASLSAYTPYLVHIYERAGASPVVSDLANLYSVQVVGPVRASLLAINGDVTSVLDFKDFVDTGYNPATHKVAGVSLVDVTTTNTDQVSADALAAAVELALVNEGDATAVLQAIADKIAGDLLEGDVTAQAIAAAVKARMEEAGSTLANLALSIADADGLTDVEFRELVTAWIAGTATLENLDGGLKKLTFFKQDGTTEKLAITFDADGQHTVTEIDPA